MRKRVTSKGRKSLKERKKTRKKTLNVKKGKKKRPLNKSPKAKIGP